MRLLILAAAATLVLGACKNSNQHDNTMNIDENLTAEKIVSNDVTAIDAVTGDAANMAADVNYTEEANLGGNETTAAAPAPRTKPPASAPRRPRVVRPTEPEQASNSSANATQ